jgi:hypothetical protein
MPGTRLSIPRSEVLPLGGDPVIRAVRERLDRTTEQMPSRVRNGAARRLPGFVSGNQSGRALHDRTSDCRRDLR